MTPDDAETTRPHASRPLSEVAPFGYRPALDGVRTLAVYLVLAFHAGMTSLENGYLGVDLFFVLSGYLITSILVVELAHTGTIRFRTFYSRRFRRLLPASAALLVLGGLMSLGLQPITARLGFADDARSAALYVANWHYIDVARDYFAEGTQSSPFLHFWSLSIEEQFYVFFPVLLLVIWRAGRARRTVVAAAVALLTLVSLAAQVVTGSDDITRAYYGTDTRIYQILLGCGLAVAARLWGLRLGRRWADLVAITSAAAILLLSTSLVEMSISTRGVLAAVLSTALVAGLDGEARWASRVAATPGAVHLGRISYGTYLWHWPVIVALDLMLDLDPWVLALTAAVLSTAMAELSAAVVEMPVRSSRSLDRRPLVAVSLGLTVSLLLAVVAPSLIERPATPLLRAVQDGSEEVLPADSFPEGLTGPDVSTTDWKTVAKDEVAIGPSPPLCRVGDTSDCALHRGDGPSVLLLGDSHALMLVRPMTRLAEIHDFTLYSQVSTGCSWVEGVTDHTDGGVPCGPLRDGSTSQLVRELGVDVVVVSERTRRPDAFGPGEKYTFNDPDLAAVGFPDAYAALMDAAFDRIQEAGARVVVVEYTPEATDDPIECLAGGSPLEECSWTAAEGDPLENALADRDATDEQLDVVSLDAVACPYLPLCIPFLDGQFVYRDKHHVQPEWWLSHLVELDDVLGTVIVRD